jgi:hypothetical protein
VGSEDLLSVEPGSRFTPTNDLSFSNGLDFSMGLDVGYSRGTFEVVGHDLEMFPSLGAVGSRW